jgi:hypothetical protein
VVVARDALGVDSNYKQYNFNLISTNAIDQHSNFNSLR